ncbi:DNA mismatch repair protein MutH [Peribacillus sp. SIMBA_075]|uniref:DNA mismatch repair protein MutH n=1 Tax=Peribacillus sp. SIMBA_075 TaxID=3085813 RepID=UPI003979F0E2
MFLDSKDKEWLLRALNVKGEEYEFKNDNDILEIINENGNPEEYYLADFREKDDGFSSFRRNIEQYSENYNIEIRPLMIFKSWEKEQMLFKKELEKVDAKGKRDINSLIAIARSVYYNKNDNISLELEECGINYLEYKVSNKESKESKGLIFNLSLQELYQLYNRTGISLFKDNVRIGIPGTKSSTLRNNFKTTFLLGLYNLNENKKLKSNEKIKDYLINSNGSENFEGYQTAIENFWFHHNGITVYSEDSFHIEEDKITFNPLKVSVINGAQTLTHCFSIIKEISNDLKNDDDFNMIVKEMMSNIKIKTIFIEADSKVKRSVTLGLNTQIPVTIEDIKTNTKDVEEINKILEQKNKKICRQGEDTFNGGIYLLDFVKSYLIFKNRPGEARNLQKNKIETYLTQFLSNGNDIVDDFLKNLDTFEYIDKWWRKRKKPENINEKDYKGLGSNGKYYFKSYCKGIYNDAEDENDKEAYFQGIYEYFINTFIKLQPNIDSNELKKDTLFELYLESLISSENDDDKIGDLQNSLGEFVVKFEEYKKSNGSKSNRSMFIKSQLEKKGIEIGFRTINLICKSENQYKLKEALPLPGQTFSQLYEINNYPGVYDEQDKLVRFEDSKFYKEIHREFYLFVFIQDESSGNTKKIELISDFTLSRLSKRAKNVYEKTVNAFQEGNVNLFVKQSDDLCFHIRPKAKDVKDTFTFTDGSQQVKRTFWVNKECLLELINDKLNMKKIAELV